MKTTHTKVKGNRRERQARDRLLEVGHFVTKSGGSLGAFDLIALPRANSHGTETSMTMPLVQVKANHWPGPTERAKLEWLLDRIPRVLCPQAQIWRWDDHRGLRILRLVEDWEDAEDHTVVLERQGAAHDAT